MNEPPVTPIASWPERLQRLRSHTRSASLFAVGVLATFVALLLYNAFGPAPPPLTTQEVDEAIAAAIASVTPAPAYSALVYQAIRPSLVFIEVQAPDEDNEISPGVGSGVIINTNGDILTSLHVVANATEIKVYFADGSESAAQVVIAQPENDIAVINASQPPLELIPAILGNPNAMRVGDEAFVVGNPLGLYSSMSAGVISGFGRSFQPEESEERLENLIQFDAAVNPGNSGGPLLNRYGQVVGIVTGLINPTEQEVFIGIGFAVPINTAAGAAGLPAY
jgi:S1-C subfamily serine protease